MENFFPLFSCLFERGRENAGMSVLTYSVASIATLEEGELPDAFRSLQELEESLDGGTVRELETACRQRLQALVPRADEREAFYRRHGLRNQ